MDYLGGGGGGGGAVTSLTTRIANLETIALVAIAGGVSLTGAAIGKVHVCSGTSANYTVTLPDGVALSLPIGSDIGFRMASGLTRLVTLAGASGQTIDGAPARVMYANETAIPVWDGANWFKLGGRSLALEAELGRYNTDFSIVAGGGWTPVPMDTQIGGAAFLFDGTNGRYICARPGSYEVVVFAYLAADSGLTYAYISIKKNATDNPKGFVTPVSIAGGIAISGVYAGRLDLAAGDTVNVDLLVPAGVNVKALGAGQPSLLLVREVPSW